MKSIKIIDITNKKLIKLTLLMLKYFIEKNDRVKFQVHDFLFKRSSDDNDDGSDAETANLI
ncbi:hypothetical protein DERP_002802 [Dermatophagoides pteronyssinus]|uniref:Uncharacterized protein n=1 Tax=Dermatophagoides pteronyssinus TaxID=6956 RepID=A0ABQ8JWS5_DERPT|nr:hypothetical protein DERP_002802 [Dermatophagoides pteronyssinus]